MSRLAESHPATPHPIPRRRKQHHQTTASYPLCLEPPSTERSSHYHVDLSTLRPCTSQLHLHLPLGPIKHPEHPLLGRTAPNRCCLPTPSRCNPQDRHPIPQAAKVQAPNTKRATFNEQSLRYCATSIFTTHTYIYLYISIYLLEQGGVSPRCAALRLAAAPPGAPGAPASPSTPIPPPSEQRGGPSSQSPGGTEGGSVVRWTAGGGRHTVHPLVGVLARSS